MSTNNTPTAEIEQLTIKVHPAAAALPLMSQAEFEALVADIAKNGQCDDIVMFKGDLIDGRNRWLACKHLGIAPEVCEVEDDEFDVVAFVASKNLYRRHLSPSQLSITAARLLPIEVEAAKKRSVANLKKGQFPEGPNLGTSGKPEENSKSRDKVAAMVGVSKGSIDHASTVLKEGSPDLIAAVEKGEVAVSRAAKVAKTTPKAKQLAKAKAKPKKGKVASLYICQQCGKQYGDGTTECDCAKGDAYEPPAVDPGETMEAVQGEYDALLNHLQQARRVFNALADADRSGPWLVEKKTRIIAALEEIRTALVATRPGGLCHECDGKGCEFCRKTGHLTGIYVRSRK